MNNTRTNELQFDNLKDKIKDFNSNINQEQFETLIENNIFPNYSNPVIHLHVT